MAAKPETTFRKRVAFFLSGMRPRVFYESISQRSIVGTPDILACMNGHFVALEIKSEGGKLSPLQKHKMQQIIDSGGLGVEVNPSNFESVKKLLTEINS